MSFISISTFFQGLPRLASLTVQCVSSFAIDFFLQTHLYHAGVLWHLLVNLFNYDYTLEESGVQANQETNQQEVANSLAKLSLVALGRLAGYTSAVTPEDGPAGEANGGGAANHPPENPSIRKSLAAMLTPYISRKLGSNTPADVREKSRCCIERKKYKLYCVIYVFLPCLQVLKLLNSNSENPYLIWNNGTRAELMEFLEAQQESNIKRVRGRTFIIISMNSNINTLKIIQNTAFGVFVCRASVMRILVRSSYSVNMGRN